LLTLVLKSIEMPSLRMRSDESMKALGSHLGRISTIDTWFTSARFVDFFVAFVELPLLSGQQQNGAPFARR
jgi:hypothetical protein